MSLYRYSPIRDKDKFDEALVYIVTKLDQLAKELVGEVLPIDTVKIFAHYHDEYKYLLNLVTKLGPAAPFNSQTSFYSQTERKIGDHNIKYVGVRVVDPYRMQVGCGDYEVANYNQIRKKHLNKSEFVRDFRGEMIELWHPDLEVLGYIVPPFE